MQVADTHAALNWKPTRDLIFVRELPVEQTGLIIPGIDLNRSKTNSPVLYGIVEGIGPRVTDVQVGDRVAYEIEAGEFRVPGDDEVRIMKEEDIAWVCEVTQ
jgi:co-chaperonin GroES (HSP10)